MSFLSFLPPFNGAHGLGKIVAFRKEKAALFHCITAVGYQEEMLEGGRGWQGTVKGEHSPAGCG